MPTGKAVSNLPANHKAQRGGFPILFAIWAKNSSSLLLPRQLVAHFAVVEVLSNSWLMVELLRKRGVGLTSAKRGHWNLSIEGDPSQLAD